MSKFYFNNVSEKKGKCGAKLLNDSLSASLMRCLLKICIGLSVLLSSFVQAVFGKPPSLRMAATSPHSRAPPVVKALVPAGKKREICVADVFFPFFLKSLVWHVSELTCHVKNVHRSVIPTGISQQKTDLSIYPTICQPGAAHFCPVALSPRVTWLRFLHEHFFIIT